MSDMDLSGFLEQLSPENRRWVEAQSREMQLKLTEQYATTLRTDDPVDADSIVEQHRGD
ncbi:hypothetical protein [Streptomyces sp. RPT161]|uniref:hypothetical protein n=1 Tax=Streptomyces sp. RPT161 TaxID=3015993 RepID=UPI0022B85D22|nr:hypothetical protein [Streptomyces sp. RPT161]